MPGHGLGTRSQTESECSKQKLKMELLRGSRPKLESLPVSVVVHEHLVRAGCLFFGTTTRRTLTRLHRQFSQALFTKVEHSDRSDEGLGSRLNHNGHFPSCSTIVAIVTMPRKQCWIPDACVRALANVLSMSVTLCSGILLKCFEVFKLPLCSPIMERIILDLTAVWERVQGGETVSEAVVAIEEN